MELRRLNFLLPTALTILDLIHGGWLGIDGWLSLQ